MGLTKKVAIFVCLLAVVFVNDRIVYEPSKIDFYPKLTESDKRQVDCLTHNIFFEAIGESLEGKMAVAFVTLNRVNSSLFPKDVCSVIKQRMKDTCQFSWYCQAKLRYKFNNDVLTKTHEKLYNETERLATFIYKNYEYLTDPTEGSLFYHADYVKPKWKNYIKTVTIGRHIFYKTEE